MTKGKVMTCTNADGTEAYFPRTKTSAVSDEAGKNLDVILGELGSSQVDLLWENAAPKQDFVAQTITLKKPISAYKYLIVFVRNYKTKDTVWFSLITPNTNSYILGGYVPSINNQPSRYWEQTNDTQIRFMNASNNDNASMVPYVIYGIK